MKIKERERSNAFNHLKRFLKFIHRSISNKKIKIVFLAVVIFSIFLSGIIFGLLLFGFFGTMDNPSQNTLDLLHFAGIYGLEDFKLKLEWIASENIKIPINYIKGQFSNPENFFIDIGFKDFQKIEYKRQQAFNSLSKIDEGILITSADDFVPANIRAGDKEIKVRLRLKGDNTEHLEGDKWSFRIKVRGNDTLFGMKTFSIQAPKTRNYINEFIYHKALKREDVFSLRYKFIEVIINGDNKGIYALEEHFGKELFEDNHRREGVIIKFNEDFRWEEIINAEDQILSETDLWNYQLDNELNWFYGSNIDTFDNEKVLEDPLSSRQFETARSLLESFRTGSLKASDVFDSDKLAKYFAVNTLLGCEHASEWNNIRFYYNPVTSLLEPIGFDAICGNEAKIEILQFSSSSNTKKFKDLIFMDEIFFEKYIQELERVSEESYLNNLFLELDQEIKDNINIIHKDEPTYHFSTKVFYENQKIIKNRLYPLKTINAYFQKSLPDQNKIILSVGNADTFQVELISLIYNNSVVLEPVQKKIVLKGKSFAEPVKYQQFEFEVPAGLILDNAFISNLNLSYKILGAYEVKKEPVLPWSYVQENFLKIDFIRQKEVIEKNISSLEFLDIDDKNKKIFIKKGNWGLNQSVIIPKGFSVFAEGGTTIDLTNRATILSYSDLQFYGTKENPIRIFSSDRRGQGIVILNSDKISNFRYVTFNDLTSPSKEGWELTGAITFYNSQFNFDGVTIKGMMAEDSLDVVSSKYKIKNSVFEDCFSDCIDDDFGGGSIESTVFINSGNDLMDISGANLSLKNLKLFDAGDKAISAGEKSNINAENIELVGKEGKTYICVASKDSSTIFIENSKFSNCKYGFAVYQKKPEYGPASISADNIEISGVENNYLIETGSSFLLGDKIILGTKLGVYEELYGGREK